MFLLSYFEVSGFRDAAVLARLRLIADLTLYLTDFLNRIFSGENAKKRDYCGGEKLRAAAVYLADVNQGAALWKPVRSFAFSLLLTRTKLAVQPDNWVAALRKGDPKSLSDGALSQICAATRTEALLLYGGCLGSVAALLLLVVALLVFGDLAHPLFIGPALTAAAALLWAHHLAGWTKRRYRKELAYRRGLGPWPQYVAEAETILGQKEADWVFLFTLRGLPHGGFWWLRLALKEGPPASARAYLRVSPKMDRLLFKQVEMDVPDRIVRDLLRLLEELDLEALTDVPSFVIDGAPCQATALRREPWFVTSASCNLMGLTPEVSQHPGAIVCSKLWDITWRLSSLR